MERVEVAVIGAGPAGLAAGRELLDTGVEHVVLERENVGPGGTAGTSFAS